MTNENKSDFKSYYPHVNVTDYLSEHARNYVLCEPSLKLEMKL